MLEINLLPVREERRRADVRQLLMQLVLMLILAFAVIGVMHSLITDDVASATLRTQSDRPSTPTAVASTALSTSFSRTGEICPTSAIEASRPLWMRFVDSPLPVDWSWSRSTWSDTTRPMTSPNTKNLEVT